MKVPPDADLLKSLSSGKCILYFSACNDKVISYFVVAEGLKATEAETIIPKGPAIKKKGKKSSARHRPVRLTNVHLKGDIDLSRDYTPTSK